MYRSAYNLLEKPFAAQPQPSFFWPGPRQAEVLGLLHAAILENRGLVLLTGEKGVGKTALLNALCAGLDRDYEWAVIGDTGPDRLAFYNAIARACGIGGEVTSKVQFLLQFSAFLHRAHEEGKRVVLLIDDCQRLCRDILEEIRHLANLEKSETKLVHILLSGRPEFLGILQQPHNRAIGQRLSLRTELIPLTLAETGEYLRHRLRVAGTEEELFTVKAIELIHAASGGNPRLINMICDQALDEGAADESRLIGRTTIEKCLTRLDLQHAPRHGVPSAEESHGPSLKDAVIRFTGSLAYPGRLLGLNDPRWRWAKYGLTLVLAAAVGLSFIPEAEKGPDRAADAGRPEVRQPAVREKAPEVLAPAVGKLEPIGKAIDLNMVERQETVARRGEEGRDRKERAESAGRDEAPPEKVDVSPGRETAGAERELSAEAPAPVGQQTPEEPAPQQEEAPVATKLEEEAAEPPSAKPETGQAKSAEARQLSPMQPAGIVLPLRPNSLELTEEAAGDFREFVEKLKDYPEAKLLVKGFVSARTNSPENIRLSEERAMGVRHLLVKSGIDPARITVKGMGNQDPIASNETSEGRTKNRRVEVEVVGGR